MKPWMKWTLAALGVGAAVAGGVVAYRKLRPAAPPVGIAGASNEAARVEAPSIVRPAPRISITGSVTPRGRRSSGAGGALASAGSGAAAGGAVGGPVGAGIGAGVGLVGDLVGLW